MDGGKAALKSLASDFIDHVWDGYIVPFFDWIIMVVALAGVITLVVLSLGTIGWRLWRLGVALFAVAREYAWWLFIGLAIATLYSQVRPYTPTRLSDAVAWTQRPLLLALPAVAPPPPRPPPLFSLFDDEEEAEEPIKKDRRT